MTEAEHIFQPETGANIHALASKCTLQCSITGKRQLAANERLA